MDIRAKRLSKAFLRAAERIAAGLDNQICYALPKATRDYKAAFALADYYISEDGRLMRGGMFGMPAPGVSEWTTEGRDDRVLALCFMAEVVKDPKNVYD